MLGIRFHQTRIGPQICAHIRLDRNFYFWTIRVGVLYITTAPSCHQRSPRRQRMGHLLEICTRFPVAARSHVSLDRSASRNANPLVSSKPKHIDAVCSSYFAIPSCARHCAKYITRWTIQGARYISPVQSIGCIPREWKIFVSLKHTAWRHIVQPVLAAAPHVRLHIKMIRLETENSIKLASFCNLS